MIISPMSPDMLPYVGSDAKVKNVFISCGHGPNGWTTSSGTGRLLTQVVFQIDSEGWSSQVLKVEGPSQSNSQCEESL